MVIYSKYETIGGLLLSADDIIKLLNYYPNAKYFIVILAIIILVFLIITIYIIIKRYNKGDNIKFWGIELNIDGRYRELEATNLRQERHFQELNSIAAQNTLILKLCDNWID
jgi:hypothetical protein